MLSYRPFDFNSDIPVVVNLLKLGLNEDHSVSNFRWKHCDNPFGKSYGLLACDDEKVVAVRMFMIWEFKKDNRIIKAFRPVDTLTHPNYRSKGIFKKLIIYGIERNRGRYDFVFNTPNKNSLSGNLKMGGNKYEKPLNYYLSFLLPSRKCAKHISFPNKKEIDLKNLEVLDKGVFKTNLTPSYLAWRFKDSVYSFAWFCEDNSKLFLVYRIKIIKGLKTLILVEYVGQEELLFRALRGLSFRLKVFAIYHLGFKERFKINIKVGDSTVVYKEDKNNIHQEINFSLGDLEGRI